MATIVFEQTLYHRPDRAAPVRVARSAGVVDAWTAEIESLIEAFGDRPGTTRCPLAVFARPIGNAHVAIARVSDFGTSAIPTGLRFHFLVVDRVNYEMWICDPFLLHERIEPTWEASEPLPKVMIPQEAFRARTLNDVQNVLKRVKPSALKPGENPDAPEFERTAENSESPLLLGAAQILVDGGRLAFERAEGDLKLAAGLWLLLPERTRSQLWPTSFAFSDALDFDLLIAPRLDRFDLEGYSTEEQAADYPEGTYELALQHAAETGTQRDLDDVFARRDSRQTLRLAWILLIAVSLIVLVSTWLGVGTSPRRTNPLPVRDQQAAAAAGIIAVGEPWTALAMILHGKTIWGEEKPANAK